MRQNRMISPRDCSKPESLPLEAQAVRDRHRYETIGGKLHHFVRVIEPSGKHWWQFWRKPTREVEYLVEPFSGKMTQQ